MDVTVVEVSGVVVSVLVVEVVVVELVVVELVVLELVVVELVVVVLASVVEVVFTTVVGVVVGKWKISFTLMLPILSSNGSSSGKTAIAVTAGAALVERTGSWVTVDATAVAAAAVVDAGTAVAAASVVARATADVGSGVAAASVVAWAAVNAGAAVAAASVEAWATADVGSAVAAASGVPALGGSVVPERASTSAAVASTPGCRLCSATAAGVSSSTPPAAAGRMASAWLNDPLKMVPPALAASTRCSSSSGSSSARPLLLHIPEALDGAGAAAPAGDRTRGLSRSGIGSLHRPTPCAAEGRAG